MRIASLLWAASLLLKTSSAIFADDAFHVDYHHALLGVPLSHATFFHKPQSSSNASLIYALSDKGYLGAINPKDGSNLWRHDLSVAGQPSKVDGFLAAGHRDGQVTSGRGNVVSCWDAMDGKLRWDYKLPSDSVVAGVQTVPASADTSPGTIQDIIVLAASLSGDGNTHVIRLAGADGIELWRHTDASTGAGAHLSLATSAQMAHVVSRSHGLLAGSKTKVSDIDIATGKERTSHSPSLDSDILALTSGCPHPILVTSENPFKNIKVNLLGTGKVSSVSIDSKGEDVQSLTAVYACGASAPNHFLIHAKTRSRQWADVYHVNSKSGEMTKAYSLPATSETSTFAAQTDGSELYFIRTTETEITLHSSESHARLGRWTVKPGQGLSAPGLHAAAEVVSGKSGYAVRVVETSANGHVSLLRNGEGQWSRPEMLAYATVASWLDESSTTGLEAGLDLEISGSPLHAYLHRLQRHLHDLQSLPSFLQSLPASLLNAPTSPVIDSRAKLVGDKVVVVGTSQNQLVALDATNAGLVLWQYSLLETAADDAKIVQIASSRGRTTAYLSDGSFAVVNSTTGHHIEYFQGSVPAVRMATVPASPENAIVKIDGDGKPQLAKDIAVPQALEGNVIVTLSETGVAFGWTMGQEAHRTWTLTPRSGFKFVSALSRANDDPVASIGKVLGDRAVLYKYISPNLSLLIASSPTALVIYLVDAVTGAVLHTSSIEGVLTDLPIPAVMSENWFSLAYSTQDPDTKSLSTQILIAELYESEASNDRGYLASRLNYSSFSADAGAKPYVITQAYTLPQTISTLAVTQTGQGITSRQLLAALSAVDGIVAIPREVLNARRPVDRDPSRDEQEEGLFKYNPVLDIDAKWFLTHSREVAGTKKILTAPSLLESTSLVFAFGHDVFGTQVNPSGTFDVLGKGFNKVQLLLTVVALFIGVLVVRPIVRSKSVDGQWKA
jgi:ER membrane protein complex subunit 1